MSNQCNIPAYALPPLWQLPTAIDLTYLIRITFSPPFWIPSSGQISILESKVPSPRKRNLKNPSLVTGALKLKQHRKVDLMKKKKTRALFCFPRSSDIEQHRKDTLINKPKHTRTQELSSVFPVAPRILTQQHWGHPTERTSYLEGDNHKAAGVDTLLVGKDSRNPCQPWYPSCSLITYRPQIQREYLRSTQQQPLSLLFSSLLFLL